MRSKNMPFYSANTFKVVFTFAEEIMAVWMPQGYSHLHV